MYYYRSCKKKKKKHLIKSMLEYSKRKEGLRKDLSTKRERERLEISPLENGRSLQNAEERKEIRNVLQGCMYVCVGWGGVSLDGVAPSILTLQRCFTLMAGSPPLSVQVTPVNLVLKCEDH